MDHHDRPCHVWMYGPPTLYYCDTHAPRRASWWKRALRVVTFGLLYRTAGQEPGALAFEAEDEGFPEQCPKGRD